jgi:hypothetical protein
MPDPVVAGIGAAGWDAGTDLFLDVARRLSSDPGVELQWIGRRSRGAARHLELDARLMGVQDRIAWISEAPPAEPVAVLVVPARTLAARDEALGRSDVPLHTVCFALPGVADPTTAGEVELVQFPDTRAMAERVRSAIGMAERRGHSWP